MGALYSLAVVGPESIAQVAAHDVAFVVIVIGILLTMTGVFGDPNLVIVGLVVSIAGLIGILVQPDSTLLVLAASIPVIGFLLFYIYRYVEFPRSRAPAQTSSAASLVGRRGKITMEATPRTGEITIQRGGFDPHYRCRTESGTIPEGEEAVVISPGGGNVLTVARPNEVDEVAIAKEQAEEQQKGWKVVHDLVSLVNRLR